MLELGKTYQLADGSGTGTVIGICYRVKIDAPSSRHNGEIPLYDDKGRCVSSMSYLAPDLLVERSGEGVKAVEAPAF